ncbi:GntR family transcriptional regulator [Clostridium thermosuccinogenes]|uniref:GntR family transcriptional regulator n=1 Tax=Clostridium thermosuccinogenes TaxID=84032 RepID=A0A2K2EZ92_9CLOT|nr:GntR family transcriptional regulator [Pseudoclostridium thermosuccinogenes]AUS96998.1 GntR family transcriptional regulator [Pseudoclostridium thermosuccinogenes]PNT91861.1 GntR family transcriptional regulator [Pseudoclostridium thermosuccinogenes]PNT94622.1 GntR family transcriptional regulator [Pseudoclostridium thermosuccinogenes]
MQWNIDSERPVYIQLLELIQANIISGNFKPGDKLPSVRDLAAEAGVNPNTMQRALTELERMELIYTNRTSGRYITSDIGVIKKLKERSAMNIIEEFLDKMKKIGFNEDEILELLTKALKEMRK